MPSPSHSGPSGNGVPVQTCRIDIGGTVPVAPDAVRGRRDDPQMFRSELGRWLAWSEHHRRLVSRLLLVLALTAIVDVVGTVAVYLFERGAAGTEIHSLGDALFFSTVQLLTVSSQIKNPLTTGGRVVDVLLEVWAVIVVAGSAGAIASFFQSVDRQAVGVGRSQSTESGGSVTSAENG